VNPLGAPAFDDAAFTALVEVFEGDREALRDAVVEPFARQGAQYLEAIRQGLAGGDLAQAELAAHGLKGASATLGLRHMSALADSLEQALRRVDPAPSASALVPLTEAFDRSCEHLHRLLETP